MLPNLLTFFAITTAFLAIYSVVSDLFFRDRSQIQQRLKKRFRNQTRDRVKTSKLFKDNTQPHPATSGQRLSVSQYINLLLQQSGLNVTQHQFMQIIGLSSFVLAVAVVAAAIGLFNTPFIITSLLFVTSAMIGACLPFIYVRFIRTRRREKLLAQLPDSFELMARIIRAGQTMPQAMSSVASEFEHPISAEFAICSEQQSVGISVDDAVRDLSNRTQLIEMKIFATAIIVQRQTGGNMAELLDNLGNIVRDRFRIRGEIKTLTAESKIQALLLIALPPFLLGIFWVVKPDYMAPLFTDPIGQGLLIATVISEFFGWLVIRKIVNFDF